MATKVHIFRNTKNTLNTDIIYGDKQINFL